MARRGVPFLLFYIGFFMLMATACAATPQPVSAPAPFVVSPTPLLGSSYTVKKGTLTETLDARGRIISLKEQSLFFTSRGWVKKLNAQPGGQLEQGELIAELDVPQLEDAVEAASYELDTSRLTLQGLLGSRFEATNLQIQRDKLQEEFLRLQTEGATFERARKQFELQEEMAKLDTAMDTYKRQDIETQINITRREIEYRENILSRATERLAKTRLEAPFSGVVISLDKKLGDQVEPFESIGILVDPAQLEVEVSVPEGDIGRVALEQPAKVVLDAFPLSEFLGKVTQMGTKPILWQGKRAFPVTIQFNEPNQVPRAIRMGADVFITTKLSINTLIVPLKSVFTEGNSRFVEVFDGGKTVRTNVETGISNKTQTEILRGLEEGAVVRVP